MLALFWTCKIPFTELSSCKTHVVCGKNLFTTAVYFRVKANLKDVLDKTSSQRKNRCLKEKLFLILFLFTVRLGLGNTHGCAAPYLNRVQLHLLRSASKANYEPQTSLLGLVPGDGVFLPTAESNRILAYRILASNISNSSNSILSSRSDTLNPLIGHIHLFFWIQFMLSNLVHCLVGLH